TFDYGAHKAKLTSGSNHARFFGDSSVMRLTTDASINYILHETEFPLDRPLNLIVGADESIPDNPDTLTKTFLAETESYWHTWVRDLNIPFDWQQAVIRAAITLKMCSYEDTGAVLAALTTSVPEAPNTPRTWDYRFTWLRDAFFTLTALNRLSAATPMGRYGRVLDGVTSGARGAQHAAHLGLPLHLAARCLLHRDRAQSPVGDPHHGKLRALHRRCRRGRQLARRGRCHRATVPDRAGHRYRRTA